MHKIRLKKVDTSGAFASRVYDWSELNDALDAGHGVEIDCGRRAQEVYHALFAQNARNGLGCVVTKCGTKVRVVKKGE